MYDRDKAALLSGGGSGAGSTLTEATNDEGMLDAEWGTAAKRRLRFPVARMVPCVCRSVKDARRDHTPACLRTPQRTTDDQESDSSEHGPCSDT